MQFCSIQEAWGNDNFISDNYYQYNQYNQHNLKNFRGKNNITQKPNIEPFQATGSDLDVLSQTSKKSLDKCDNIIEHVLNCPYCYKKIKNKLYNNFYMMIRNSIEDYREPIILILITVFIILLVNLILKMD